MGGFFLIGLDQTLLLRWVIANLLVPHLYFLLLLTHYLPRLELLIEKDQDLFDFFELRPEVVVDHYECEDIAQIDHYNASIE